jgi:hypothetical protein
MQDKRRSLWGLPRRAPWVLCAVFASLIFLLSPHGWGQAVSATLLGAVTDNTGAVVPNAQVQILESATGIQHAGVTNESGNFTFPDLTPGTYTVTAESQGFKKVTRTNVDVVVNTTTRVDLSLEPGSINETVQVTAAPPIMQTDRADVSANIEAHTLAAMPVLVNQNFQSLLTLVPGVGPPVFQHSQFFNAASSIQTEVNGQPRMGNSFQIEGVDDDERTGLLQILIPPLQSIQTVDVSTANYEAELGRAVGAVTNVIIKSGTNQFHGSASEYLQNSEFQARSYFNKGVGHLAYNYFGGGVGGPIIKDKLFFYGDYYRSPDHEANSNILTIPPPQWYTPNSAGFIDLSGPLQSSGKGQIYDPATGTASGAGRTPFPNNQIPFSRVNPVSLALLKLLPAPNTNVATSTTAPSNNFSINLPFQKTTTRYDIKIDYQVTPKDHLSGRYNKGDIKVFQAPAFGAAGGGPAQSAFAGTGTQNTYSTGINYDRAFSGTLLTEARIGVANYGNSATPTGYGTDYATQAGIPGVNISQFTSGQVGIIMSDFTPGSTTTPLFGYSASLPWIRAETNIDGVNHWTKIIRNHTVKFGVDIRRVHDDLLQDQTFSPRGAITFMENNTSQLGAQTNVANEMASFLLDVPQQAGRDLNTFFPAYRQWWFFTFAGDKWQVTPKLTTDLGIRWEFYPPATPKNAQGFSNYDPATSSLVIAGKGSNPSNLGMQTRYNYFAPRVGFAYRASEETVIRGGFGFSYTPFEDNTYAYNYPVRANNSYQQLNNYQPALLSDGSPATFQAGFPAPVQIAIPDNGIISVNTPYLRSQNYVVIPKNYYNPYVESWNVAVQQSLPQQWTMTVSYVANHGVHIGSAQNINLPPALGLGTAGEPEYIANKRSANTTVYFLGFSSNYQSLQAQLNRRFNGGLGVTTSFTWGKGLGYQTGDDGNLYFWIDQRHNYAPNDFDHRLNFEESLNYVLPFGPGKRWLNSGIASSLIGGWQIAAIVSLYSGLPFNVSANAGTINTPGQAQNANLVAPFHALHGIGTAHPWFDPSSFAQPAGCPKTGACPVAYGSVLGNVGRNAYYGPGYIQDNLSIFKTFAIWESVSLETRADAFQLSNSPQFQISSPQNITSTTFGKVTSTIGSGTGINGIGGGRSIQLSGTVRF